MNVLHVIPSLDPASGGPPMVAARLAAAQSQAGWNTRLVSYRFPKAQKNIETALATIPHFDAVHVDFLNPLTRRERVFASRGRKDMADIVRQSDIVHLHGVWDPLIYVTASVARQQQRAHVLTPHGMLDPWAISQKKWKKKLAMTLGYRRMLNGTAFLHFLNSDEQSLTAPLHLRCRGEVIPNGIFLEEIDPLPPAGRFFAAQPNLRGRPFILFLSRLHYKKGLDFLGDAFAIVSKQIPDVQLVVAGPDDGARDSFEKQIRSLNLLDRVHLVGPLYGPAKLQALVDSTLFCLPSRQEGFSLAVTEAMACGVPVVISESCHFPEVAGANAGLIVKLQPQAIAAALVDLLGNRERASQMGKCGRELVINQFTWPSVARRMIDAYGRALSSKP